MEKEHNPEIASMKLKQQQQQQQATNPLANPLAANPFFNPLAGGFPTNDISRTVFIMQIKFKFAVVDLGTFLNISTAAST